MTRSGGEFGRLLGVLALSVVAVCALTTGLHAEEPSEASGVPRVMMYEGFITDDVGKPLAGRVVRLPVLSLRDRDRG